MKTINIQKANEENHKRKYQADFKESIKYLPRHEMQLLLNHIATTEIQNRKRNTLMFKLLLSLGCRVTEFVNIKVCDIDLDTSMLIIHKENTKTKQTRHSRINKELLLDLKDYIKENKLNPGSYLFYNSNTNYKLTPKGINYILNKYSKDLDLSIRVHAHVFRHSHIVYSLESGVPINAVMKNVGHIRITTTQIYADIVGTTIRDNYNNAKVNF